MTLRARPEFELCTGWSAFSVAAYTLPRPLPHALAASPRSVSAHIRRDLSGRLTVSHVRNRGRAAPDLSTDGVHPTREGYLIMDRVAETAIRDGAATLLAADETIGLHR